MRVVAFDIETVPDYMGVNLKDYLYLKTRGQRERTEEEVERDISFNPFTLYVISLAMVTVEDDRIREGQVIYASDMSGSEHSQRFTTGNGEEVTVRFVPVTEDVVEDKLYDIEHEILRTFWERLKGGVDRLISFNGYDFDGYVIRIRSMLHGLLPTSNLLEDQDGGHVDLLRSLSGWDRAKRFSLDFICRKFGIYTPKDRIDGSKVAEEFFKGNYRLIAEYNLKDTLALAQLYLKIKDFLWVRPPKPASEAQINKIAAILSKICPLDFNQVKDAVKNHVTASKEANTIINLLEDIEKRIL